MHLLDLKYQAKYDEINNKRFTVISGQHEPSGAEVSSSLLQFCGAALLLTVPAPGLPILAAHLLTQISQIYWKFKNNHFRPLKHVQ